METGHNSHVTVVIECEVDCSITGADSKGDGVMTVVNGLLVVTQLEDFPVVDCFVLATLKGGGLCGFVVGGLNKDVGTRPQLSSSDLKIQSVAIVRSVVGPVCCVLVALERDYGVLLERVRVEFVFASWGDRLASKFRDGGLRQLHVCCWVMVLLP